MENKKYAVVISERDTTMVFEAEVLSRTEKLSTIKINQYDPEINKPDRYNGYTMSIRNEYLFDSWISAMNYIEKTTADGEEWPGTKMEERGDYKDKVNLLPELFDLQTYKNMKADINKKLSSGLIIDEKDIAEKKKKIWDDIFIQCPEFADILISGVQQHGVEMFNSYKADAITIESFIGENGSYAAIYTNDGTGWGFTTGSYSKNFIPKDGHNVTKVS